MKSLPISVITFIFLTLSSETVWAVDGFDPIQSGIKMLWGLLIVLALLLGLYYLLRKRISLIHSGNGDTIKLLEIKHIPPKKSLILIEVDGTRYLVGAGSDSINTIVPLNSNSFAEALLSEKSSVE